MRDRSLNWDFQSSTFNLRTRVISATFARVLASQSDHRMILALQIGLTV